MKTDDDFEALFPTLQLDPKSLPNESLREATTTGPTVAFTNLPSVDLGTTTSPEFELGPTIGEGGMGVVRLARQFALYREVAVKTLRPDRLSDTARDGLLHEALVTGGLEHPNVVPIYTLGQTTDGAPVIVMKRIEGVPWDECIEDEAKAAEYHEGDLLGWHLEVFNQLCQAVHFAHSRGIIHRDIKPENVMVGSFGEVYLVDWGVAVTTDEDKSHLAHASKTSGVCGTPCYMAPEMTTGRGEDLGVHTDVYLLGATLFHVVTGEPPHRGSSLFEIMHRAYESQPLEPDAPDELVEILQRAMSRDPADRFESADALRRAVLDFDRHRSSIAVAHEAGERLDELSEIVGAAAPQDDARVRELVGECRFGSEQALKLWPDNAQARDIGDDAARQLAWWELGRQNVDAAAAAVALVSTPSPQLERALEEARRELRERQADVAELRRMQSDHDLGKAAHTRAVAGAIAVVCWTTIPLLSGFSVRSGFGRVTAEAFLWHGWFIAFFLSSLLWVLRKPLTQNHANRRILRVAIAFAVWVPCYRFLVLDAGIDVVAALAMELTIYGLVVGAIAVMSDRWATLPVIVYLGAGLLASKFPYWVYELNALANLLGMGWLTWVWFRQAKEVENVSGDEPPAA